MNALASDLRDRLAPSIVSRHITAQRHPTLPLTLFNYSAKCQFERFWTPETMLARGLILDDDGKIVARPFPKMFNLDEITEPLPDEPFVVHEKVDGSLFLVCRYGDEIVTATRGSFTGPQAVLGRAIFDEYDVADDIEPGLTYCFELIDPSNRIVVDYGARRELVQLAVLDNETGRNARIAGYPAGIHLPMRQPCLFSDLTDIAGLADRALPNAEGFVVHFTGESNLRLKVKFAEYKRLHKLLTGVNERDIWEAMRDGTHEALEALLDRVPDEFNRWVHQTMAALRRRYDEIERSTNIDFFRITADVPVSRTVEARKAFAASAVTCAHPSVLFAMWDCKQYQDMIWRAIRPEATRPFREDEA